MNSRCSRWIVFLWSGSLRHPSFVVPGHHPIHYSHVHIWDHPSYNTALLKKVTPLCSLSDLVDVMRLMDVFNAFPLWTLHVSRNNSKYVFYKYIPVFFFFSLFLIVLVISDLMALVRYFLFDFERSILTVCESHNRHFLTHSSSPQHFFFLVQDYGSWLDIGTRWVSWKTHGLEVLNNYWLITWLILHTHNIPPSSLCITRGHSHAELLLSLAALAIMWLWCQWPSSWCCSVWLHTSSPHKDSICGGDPRCTSPKWAAVCMCMMVTG